MAILSSWQRFWVNAWPHRWRLLWHVPRFLKTCPEPFRGEVLEVGAGKGWTSRRILETFPQVELTAVDVDPRVLETFAQLARVYGKRLHVRQADVTALPFDRDAFDFVVGINIVRHLQKEERQLALTEFLRVLRPGGLLGLCEANIASKEFPDTWEEIKRRLSQEKCEVLYASTQNGFDIWVRKEYVARSGLTSASV